MMRFEEKNAAQQVSLSRHPFNEVNDDDDDEEEEEEDEMGNEKEEEEPVRLRMRKEDAIGSYLALNKRAYEYAISSACKLKNLEYATMLYSILTSNRVRPRKNALFSILSVRF